MVSEECKRARRKALLLLQHMDRTEKGLSDRLYQAGFSCEEVADAMQYVKSYGYINDLRYAQNYISYRLKTKSRQKIFMELQQKGIARDVIQMAWEEVIEIEEPDEKEILRNTVEKKIKRNQTLDEKELRRLYSFLIRRGFKISDIRAALEEMNITQTDFREF